jgi:hypothetical protein
VRTRHRGGVRTLLALLAAVVMAPATEPVPWCVVASGTGALPGDAGRWWTLSATRDGPGAVRLVVLAPDFARCRLEVVTGSGDRPQAERDALALPGTIAVLNAGYFDGGKRPVGWRAAAGTVSGTIDDGPACTGFAWCDGAARMHLTRRADGAPVAAAWGVQAGPFLIDPGGAHGIARAGGPAARRSAVALTGDGKLLLIAIDHPLTLAATADLLLTLPAALGIQPLDGALNLDGGPSTTLAVPALGLSVASRGPVIDAWRLVAR